jgi:hypothetical protein
LIVTCIIKGYYNSKSSDPAKHVGNGIKEKEGPKKKETRKKALTARMQQV